MDPRDFSPDDVAQLFADLDLSGVAQIFPERCRQALDDKLGILEFLGPLLKEEVAARRQRRFLRLLREGNLEAHDGWESYDFDLARSRGVDVKIVRDLVGGALLAADPPRNVILAGAVGAGKSRLARLLAFETVRRDCPAVFVNTADMIEELFRRKDSYLFPKTYRHYVNARLLALDDLAYLPFAPEKVEFLFRVVCDRTEQKTGPLVVTTNTDVTEWWRFFPSQAMGMAFSDRVLGGAVGIKFSGPSLRSDKPPERPKK